MEESEAEQFSFPLTSFNNLSVKEGNKLVSNPVKYGEEYRGRPEFLWLVLVEWLGQPY